MYRYFNILTVFLILATIVSLLRRKHVDTRFQKLMPYFLLFVCLVLVITVEYSRPVPHKSNHWIYNIYTPIECLFYSFLLFENIKGSFLRKLGNSLIIIYCLFSLYNIFFLQGFWLFNNYSYVVGSFVIVSIGLFFFIETASSEDEQPLLRNPAFWITSGLIISQLGNFTIMALLEYLLQSKKHFMQAWKILRYLNSIMYLLFTVAFLCKQLKPKGSSLSS